MKEKETILSKAVEASKSSQEIKFSPSLDTETLEKYFLNKEKTDSFNKAILASLD